MPRWQEYARTHYPWQQLVNFPRTYFEVEDVRLGEEEGQAILEEMFVSTPGGLLIRRNYTEIFSSF
jgi:hypothetical protein